MRIIVGITGASGSIYAVRLLEELSKRKYDLHAVFSKMGEEVMRFECATGRERFPSVKWHEHDNMFSEIASGTSAADQMVVVPCSIHTLSCIAHGISGNLLQRAAAVTLKEKRNLILVPRETPVNSISLESMLTLSKAGATILPASPGFYHYPKTIDDLVDHVVEKILSLMNMPHELFRTWTNPNTAQIDDQKHTSSRTGGFF